MYQAAIDTSAKDIFTVLRFIPLVNKISMTLVDKDPHKWQSKCQYCHGFPLLETALVKYKYDAEITTLYLISRIDYQNVSSV